MAYVDKTPKKNPLFFSKAEFKVMGRLSVSLYRLLLGYRSVPALIEKWARLTPDRTAVYFEDRRLSYRELDRKANQVANHFLEIGARQGDVVAVFMENCPEYLALIAGLNKIGLVASLINTHLRQLPLSHAFTICEPRWAVIGRSLYEAVEEVMDDIPLDEDHVRIWDGEPPAGMEERGLEEVVNKASGDPPPPSSRAPASFDAHVINIYTSGTTGLPKAARVSNRRIFFSGYALGHALGQFSGEDVIYTPLPLYHSIGIFVGWGSALAVGAGFGIRRRFSASEFWREAIEFGATGATFIGEMPRFLLAQPESPEEKEHNIRRVITVGLRGNIWEEFQERFGIDRIFEFYGATETNVGIMNIEGRPGYLGRLMPLQAAVVKWDPEQEAIIRNDKGRCEWAEEGEEGMLIGRVSRVLNLLGFDGYVDEEATQTKLIDGVFKKRDRFFVTGDVVKLHPDRWVSFVDRSGDTFRWKGENVATKEVECVLDGCEMVCDVNVYGVKVPGEEGAAGMAAIVPEGEFLCDDFSKFVARNLPFYARPLFVRVMKELPMTVTMKHIKYVLKKDGFDPSKVEDPVYFWDRHEERYKLLDDDLYADILHGNLRL